MSFSPASLTDLGKYLMAHGVVNLGVVGNERHCGGYHLGKDRIYGSCACKPDGTCEPGQGDADYSVKRPRDKIGLTQAASAIDIGRVNGTLEGLRALSIKLVKACQAGLARDIREVIYSPDGKTVYRWESSDNTIRTGPGQGDASHLTHTHISYYRDSQLRDKIELFRSLIEGEDNEVAQAKITNQTPLLMDVAKGVTFYDLDGTTPLGTFQYGGFSKRYSPYGVSGLRAMYAHVPLTSDNTRLVLVAPEQTYPIVDSTPVSQADYDAALARAQSAESSLADRESRLATIRTASTIS